jgi:hypothetical protein
MNALIFNSRFPIPVASGYVVNDFEIHASIVSESVGWVNANQSPNDEVERRGVVPTTNEADLSKSSTSSLAHRRRGPVIARTAS